MRDAPELRRNGRRLVGREADEFLDGDRQVWHAKPRHSIQPSGRGLDRIMVMEDERPLRETNRSLSDQKGRQSPISPETRAAACVRIIPPTSDGLGRRAPGRGGVEVYILRHEGRTTIADIENAKIRSLLNSRPAAPHRCVRNVPVVRSLGQANQRELGDWVTWRSHRLM